MTRASHTSPVTQRPNVPHIQESPCVPHAP